MAFGCPSACHRDRDRGAERDKQDEGCNGGRPSRRDRHEERGYRQLQEWQRDRRRAGEPIRNAERRYGLPRSATIDELRHASYGEDAGQEECDGNERGVHALTHAILRLLHLYPVPQHSPPQRLTGAQPFLHVAGAFSFLRQNSFRFTSQHSSSQQTSPGLQHLPPQHVSPFAQHVSVPTKSVLPQQLSPFLQQSGPHFLPFSHMHVACWPAAGLQVCFGPQQSAVVLLKQHLSPFLQQIALPLGGLHVLAHGTQRFLPSTIRHCCPGGQHCVPHCSKPAPGYISRQFGRQRSTSFGSQIPSGTMQQWCRFAWPSGYRSAERQGIWFFCRTGFQRGHSVVHLPRPAR